MMEILGEAISAAKLAESLGLIGVLMLLLFLAGYMIYKVVILEHKKLIETLDAIKDTIVALGEGVRATNETSRQMMQILSDSNSKSFDLHHNSIVKIFDEIKTINHKLDRALERKNV